MLLLDAPTLVVADVLDCRLLLRILVDPSADTMKADEFTVADAARVKLKEAKEANRDSADNGALIVVSLELSSFLFLCSHCVLMPSLNIRRLTRSADLPRISKSVRATYV
jgi:hypothetical protein